MRAATILVLLLLASPRPDAGDWPMAGGDAQRSGYTSAELPSKLSLRWTFVPAHPPMPAWPLSDRLGFDRAAAPVVAGGLVFFGSSADGKITALDAATGQTRWSFFTGGPVRFAPAAWKDRVFAVSDDGHLYCLQASDGRLLWKKRGGPSDRWVLGNDRLISHWPARGGPVVADGVVYFGAGLWPSDGIYLYALDAETGEVRWCNDQSGAITMAQPHSGANAESGVSAQGLLVVAGDLLLVPTGRAVPAAFARSDGSFKYFHLQQNGRKGGASAMAAGSLFLNGGLLFDAATGAMLEAVGAGVTAATPDGIVSSTDEQLSVLKIVDKEKIDRKGATLKQKGLEKQWTAARVPGGESVIAAGRHLVSGGVDRVGMVDASTQKLVWSAKVDGAAAALAVAGGRLYVSTTKGLLYCFGAGDGEPVVHRPEAPKSAAQNGLVARAAQAILEKSGIVDGYAVDLGCGDGALTYELARRSRLQITAIERDPVKVAIARRTLEAAGLYGVRVTVHEGDPAAFPLPKSFASLVVSGRSITEGVAAAPADVVLRVQRPYGGTACLGGPDAMKTTVRGALEGAGEWTHQYADAANTSCSADTIVRGPLTLSWFRESDFAMPQRHGRGPSPLSFEGRMFVEGLHGIRAADAYTGRPLWEVSLPDILKDFNADHLMGTAGTGSNLCLTSDGVYVRTGRRCLRLDLATGKKLGEFEAPPLPGGKPGIWGYLACEKGTLYGSLVNEEHIVKWRFAGKTDMSGQLTESVMLFAMDALTGRVKWTRPAKDSFRHNAIAIGGGKVFVIDRPIAEVDKITADEKKPVEHPKGVLLALDAATGAVAWKEEKDVFGTVLVAGVRHDALLMAYQATRFKLPSEKGGEMAALRMSDGKPLWAKKAAYGSRPTLVDRTIYAQGGAWDLLTGEEQKWDLKRSYGCGQLACSAHLAVYRSATMGYKDFVSSKEGTSNYGGIRLGCWINAIPAGGQVLAPDATTGCTCSYLNQAWIALTPKD
jgi:outer membrane protein assembly factor BamB